MFEKGQQLFKEGRLTDSKLVFQEILRQQSLGLSPILHYECLLNLSTIYLQLNQIEKAKELLKTAILLNHNRYEAFYNFSIVNYHLKQYSGQSIKSLQTCLSLLYLEIGSKTQSLKLINKAISLNPTNPKAYINRALIYQQTNKIKLAENQYEKLTFQNDIHQFSSQIMIEIYLQKCLFYRRINKLNKMEENLAIYNKLKREHLHNKTQNHISLKISQILQDASNSIENQIENKQRIKVLLSQIHGLIKQINGLNQQRNTAQNFNISLQKHQVKNQQNLNNTQKSIQQLSIQQIKQEIHNKSQNVQQKNNNQQYPSMSFNQDQDSAILNHKIEELQRQIKQSGGNVPQIKDISRNQEQQNFLEFEIQKTIEQINKKKLEQHDKKLSQNLKSSTQRNSFGENPKSLMSNDSDRRKSSFQDDVMSLRSKISQSYEINLEEMKSYESFQLQVRSVSMFDQNCSKKEAYIKIKYMHQQLLTQKCKNQKLTWNHNFDEETLIHPSQENEDETFYHILVEVHAKQGGWLSWNKDILLGRGTIKLTQKGATKCTLELNEEKVGMLYYKIKLRKKPIKQEKQ